MMNEATTAQIETGVPERGWAGWFAVSAGIILGLTGLAKVYGAGGDVKLLGVMDPIFGVPFKQLMLAVGVAELFVAGTCLFTRAHRVNTFLVVWLATGFLIYRTGMWWLGWKKPCGCLGNITDALGITPQTADFIIKMLLAYLLVGGYALLLWQWRRTGSPVAIVSSEPVSRAADDVATLAARR
jgi:hypothetical protein